jgi:hypothetical protein
LKKNRQVLKVGEFMTPVIALGWIATALASIFGAKLGSQMLGFDLTMYRPVPANTPVPANQLAPTPPPNSLAKDLLSNPSNMWALAALAFAGVFVIAQLRAAGADAAAGVRGVYKEAQVTTRALADPNTQMKRRKR